MSRKCLDPGEATIGVCRSILLLILFTTSPIATSAGARDLVAESARYQQEWKPSTIEFVIDDLVLDASTNDKLTSDEKAAIERFPPLLRTALSAYANEFGLAVSFVPRDKPCADSKTTTRIVISLQPGKLKEMRMPTRVGLRVATLPVQVTSPTDCSHRPDNFTLPLHIAQPNSSASGSGKSVEAEDISSRSIRNISQDVIDEMLLIWHPAWTVPVEDPKPFTSFALQPVFPPVSTGFRFTGSNRGINGLVITPIDTARPPFRWSALEELAERGIPGTAARMSEIRYEFRLHAAAGDKTLAFMPGKELLHLSDLAEPVFNLPAALESCQAYFWTVRARFRLDGFPRVTEWTELHNSPTGLIPPWVFRRGESIWSAWDSALAYPAFRTPSAVEARKCP